jgi:hypothetical protein
VIFARYQQIAVMEERGGSTGRIAERRLEHASREAEAFYRALQARVVVGIEATGLSSGSIGCWPNSATRCRWETRLIGFSG